MKQYTNFLAFLSIILLIILICVTASAEGGRGGGGLGDGKGNGTGDGNNITYSSSIWTDLLSIKYLLGGFIALLGLILLKTIKINQNTRTILMCFVFVLFGVLVIMHGPSPIRSIVDPLTSILTNSAITYKKLTMLLFISGLTIVGSKLFCGWVCPFGAIQEIINKISVPFKTILSFKVTNSIRLLLFIISAIMVLTIGSDLYTYNNILNPFELFDWTFGLVLAILVGVVLIASLFVYRPYCYLICPVGLLTWLLEYVSIFRVRVDRNKCNDCGICVLKSPCPSIKPILDSDIVRPDCFSCGICIEACPKDALEFRFIKKK
ncbi:MAG: 4Fe-4S binding protein [Methanosarcinales archaeon]|nr:4Fe-4S binding protein [Methanosarcinales archaeon]